MLGYHLGKMTLKTFAERDLSKTLQLMRKAQGNLSKTKLLEHA